MINLFSDDKLEQRFKQINPLVRELAYDRLTPIMAYAAVGGVATAMMESAYDEGYGKASFIGINPLATLRHRGNSSTLEYAQQCFTYELDPYQLLPAFTAGRKAFGFVSYDAVRLKEQLPDRHAPKPVPDMLFRLYRTVINFDHQAQKLIITHEGSEQELNALVEQLYACKASFKPTPAAEKLTWAVDISDDEFAAKVLKAKEYIRQGDIFQVVLSRTFSAELNLSAFAVYRALRQLNPTPYLFLFDEGDYAIAGASPELLVGVKDGVIETVPIAGTCKKGENINLLLADAKETAEHIMLVDLARNDIGAVAKPGTVVVAKLKNVKTYSHVSHIVSQVLGQLAPEYNVFAVLKSVLPAGTLSGAPKIRAMEIIDELELSRRGIYGGAAILIDECGNLTSAIAIRTIFKHGNTFELRTGAGIVYDSQPDKEVAETYLKARGGMQSVELALRGEL